MIIVKSGNNHESNKKLNKIRNLAYCLILALVITCIPEVKSQATTICIGEYYYIQSALNSNMVLDVSGGKKSNGTNIQLWEKNGSDAQLFKIARNGNGYYTFINKNSNRAIDVKGGVTSSGANVQLWDQNSTKAQQWKLYTANGYSDGYIRIMNKSGKYLDVSGGKSVKGTNIQIWDGNNTKSQVFKLVPYVETSYTTVTLGSFSTIDQWKREMQYAEQKVVGFSRTAYNLSGNITNYGKMITGKTALAYKTINVTYSQNGKKITKKVKLPYKVKFKLHKHVVNQKVWFDFSNVTLTQTCTCGEWSQVQWEVPYP